MRGGGSDNDHDDNTITPGEGSMGIRGRKTPHNNYGPLPVPSGKGQAG